MGLIIEGGIYFLLLFTPFAFGGVETWAQGVFEIVAGLVVAAWVWERFSPTGSGGPTSSSAPRALAILWIAIALFHCLVLVQLVPLPPAWIHRLSPGVYDLYARTLPGYAEGRDFEASELPAWLLARHGDRIPATGSTSPLPEPALREGAFALSASSWRTLSIYPFETWKRLHLLFSLTGLFAVAASWYRSRERLARLVAVIAVAGFAVSLCGIIQKLTWNEKLLWFREGNYQSIFGPFVNRNSYAAFAGTVLPLALCMALSGAKRIEERRRGAVSQLLVWGAAMVVTCAGIFYSLSRGGIISSTLALAVVAVMLLYYGRGAKDLAVLAAMGLAAAGFLTWIGPEAVIERVGTLSEGQHMPSMVARIGSWRLSFGLISSSPVIGSGLGTFRFAFMRFAPAGEGWWNEASDEYLEVLSDTGVIGGAIFVIGLATWLALVVRPSRVRESNSQYLYVGLIAGLAGLLVHAAVSSVLQVPANALLLVLSGGALVPLVAGRGASRRSRGRSTGSRDDSRPAVATAGRADEGAPG